MLFSIMMSMSYESDLMMKYSIFFILVILFPLSSYGNQKALVPQMILSLQLESQTGLSNLTQMSQMKISLESMRRAFSTQNLCRLMTHFRLNLILPVDAPPFSRSISNWLDSSLEAIILDLPLKSLLRQLLKLKLSGIFTITHEFLTGMMNY